MPKITVYITTHNYGQYVDKAIQSVLQQTVDDWELIVIDDGSTDNTGEMLDRYRKHTKVQIVEQKNKGLNVTNNIALRLAAGKYIMRLDADDYLDENILLVLSNVLDTKPDVGLVYPDYYLVDQEGQILEIVRRKKIGEEVELLDLPAHGACTMIRKENLLEIGGYYEDFNRQDGYDLWIKFIQHYNPYNVNIPLFYYRQHEDSLTKDKAKLLETRSQIIRKFVEQNDISQMKVLCVVPVLANPAVKIGAPFVEMAGKPLISYTLDEVVKAKLLERVVVSSGSQEVLDHAGKYSGVGVHLRAKELMKTTSPIEKTLVSILDFLENEDGYIPDAVCVCYINHPFRRAEHIDKAIDTMRIFNVDSVLSIQEELSFCYHHRRNGLEPINGGRKRNFRLEREAILKENGAIFLTRTDVLRSGKFLGEKVGHITMLPEESAKINSEFEFWVAEKWAAEINVKKGKTLVP